MRVARETLDEGGHADARVRDVDATRVGGVGARVEREREGDATRRSDARVDSAGTTGVGDARARAMGLEGRRRRRGTRERATVVGDARERAREDGTGRGGRVVSRRGGERRRAGRGGRGRARDRDGEGVGGIERQSYEIGGARVREADVGEVRWERDEGERRDARDGGARETARRGARGIERTRIQRLALRWVDGGRRVRERGVRDRRGG